LRWSKKQVNALLKEALQQIDNKCNKDIRREEATAI